MLPISQQIHIFPPKFSVTHFPTKYTYLPPKLLLLISQYNTHINPQNFMLLITQKNTYIYPQVSVTHLTTQCIY
jgi:hypothetical protein